MSSVVLPQLLTQNSLLKPDGVFKWSLPAWAIRLSDGRKFNCCPNAGVCAQLCYARTGFFMMPEVRAAHERNLRLVLDHLAAWERIMAHQLRQPRYRGKHVRIHDSGDFFSDDYLSAWLRIMRGAPWVTFYAYTKEISRFKRLVEPDPPTNFHWIYSLGGKEDHLIDRTKDRHADVFPDVASAQAAGYSTKLASDLFAIYNRKRIGLIANNIPHFRKRQGDQTFAGLQQQREQRKQHGNVQPGNGAGLPAADQQTAAGGAPANGAD
jgi:hypothetical protein